MATPSTHIPLNGLVLKLVQDGLLEKELAQRIHTEALNKGMPFVSLLVSKNVLNCEDIAQAAADEFGTPLLDIDAIDIDPEVIRLVDEKLVRKHHALPIFKRGKRLFIAVSDPTNQQGLDEIKFHVGMGTEAILVQDDKLTRAIETSLQAQDTSLTDFGDTDLADVKFIEEEQDSHQDITDVEADDTPVVRFVNKVLLDAIKKEASDIHFEPYEDVYRVRLRLDGVLHEIAKPPRSMAPRLAARLKVMSRLDISERRLPQDGRIKLNLSKNRHIDFRVNTCPTLYGEKIVLRILDPASTKIGVDALGFEVQQKELFLEALHKPYGMILVTGPTGSGKTVTLYTGVNILNQPDINISTVEDPVEINMPGINQVNVNPKVGLGFAEALRAFLRQDPDVILVGEIRDVETAEIGIKAAQTGHLVLSTLHTNDAPQSLTRLVNMGVPPYNIASAVNLIIAQRLARRLCDHCKHALELPHETLLDEGFSQDEIDAGLRIYGAKGCDRCTGGYRGRIGIYQVMPVSEAMGRLIMEGCNAMHLADQALQEGIPDLRRSGLKKVKHGITSLDEINRITKD